MEILESSALGYLVDLVPALRYLPRWLPGMQFKRDASRWKKEICELEDTVFEAVKENTLSDDPGIRSSFMFKRMEELRNKYEEGQDIQQQSEDEVALAHSGLAIFMAGLDTTGATIQTFIYAMTLFPSVQEKARAEIDRVVGSARFPSFKDQPDLPFLHAVVLETLRWNPVAAFGLPHVSREDAVYDGYFIPKGTCVFANAWGFTRDSEYYTNPSMFDPERYLKQPPELDPREFVFGYGPRICPGKDLAFQNVWILAASVLWAFNIVGGEGRPASLADVDLFSFGSVNRPTPFECRFVSRREGLKDKVPLNLEE
ncbi:hypothetical protein M407DRAFT_23023 [Tulasnella calospora MUT 4182]|uniref:Cytochrome P450 n=1 Tax=Tulasnella calospora MUT 4182 TaxID=1051891 RepID=A0A0C3L1T1_9AGAM|nr:hypothetical protein M407DRAFT_23023 [Tulasnella calospora MUT 4182]